MWYTLCESYADNAVFRGQKSEFFHVLTKLFAVSLVISCSVFL